MLGFGLLQEQSKIKVNHYLRVGDAQQFWDDDVSTRTTWWDAHAPVGRHNFYVSRSTWPLFHGLTRPQLVAFKWGLSAAILLFFFVLDVLFLRAMGVPERVPWLVLIYVTAGLPMVGLGFSPANRGTLACDMSARSRRPSLRVLVPWFLARMNATDHVA